MSDDDYREGYKAGYSSGFSDGTGAGYSDAKVRAYLALDAVQASKDAPSKELKQLEQALATIVGLRK